jgi:excisionase family DNA binding protein
MQSKPPTRGRTHPSLLTGRRMRMTKAADTWLTVKDVARRFQVTERTVRNWIKAKLLIVSKFGGRVRIHPSEVERFSRSNRMK